MPAGGERWLPCPECLERDKVARAARLSGVPEYERSLLLSDIALTGGATDALVTAARSFMIYPRRILTLHGGSGNAKTMLLRALVNECMAVGLPAAYVKFKALLDHIRAGYADDDAQRRVGQWKAVRVLCIDEIDKVKVTEWVEEFRTDFFDDRYEGGLAGQCGTVLAMNDSPSLLPDWIASRLYDGRNKIVHNTDPDVRPEMEG